MGLLLLAEDIPIAEFFQGKILCRSVKSFTMDTPAQGGKRSHSETAWLKQVCVRSAIPGIPCHAVGSVWSFAGDIVP